MTAAGPALALLALLCGAGCGGAAFPASAPEAGGEQDPATGVRLMVGPDDAPGTAVLEAVASARRRVLTQMYMLTAPEAVSALLAAHAAGIDVRVLLEPTPYGAPTANQGAFAVLAGAGVDVRWSGHAPGLLHTKLIIVDGAVAYVMTLNLTGAGLRSNREYVAVVREPDDVRWAERIWNSDAVGADPGGGPVGGSPLVVSPLNARERVQGEIDRARASILVEMEELSDGALTDRLAEAEQRGVSVTVVAPEAGRSGATTLTLRRLADAGVTVRRMARPVVHAKAMVVDGRHAYLGSVNFTRASLDDNREVGVLVENVGLATRLAAVIASDAAAGVPF